MARKVAWWTRLSGAETNACSLSLSAGGHENEETERKVPEFEKSSLMATQYLVLGLYSVFRTLISSSLLTVPIVPTRSLHEAVRTMAYLSMNEAS